MLNIPCVIFAGGKSSRMGEDKSLLPFSSSSTLTQFQLSRLNKIFKTVYISCKESSKFDFKANFIEDIQSKNIFAPSIAFISIFEKLSVEKFFVISVDSPFISKAIIDEIFANDDKSFDATIAKTINGIEPMCGIYHRSMQAKLMLMVEKDNHKLGQLLKNSKTNYINFENTKLFLNINNPSEYQKALTLI